MTFCYEATVNDIAEPAVRVFLRTKTSGTVRMRNTFRGALFCGAAAVLIAYSRGRPDAALVAGIGGAAFGAALDFFTYEWNFRRRMRKHVERENKGRLPSTTIYTVEDGKLSCDSLGVTVSFSLGQLESVVVGKEWMEVSFGKVGLCVIPLRAFRSADERENFASLLNQGKTSVVSLPAPIR